MPLSFPNQSRSYDKAAGRIRFVGHDGVFEISFSLEVGALSDTKTGKANGEAAYLTAFDAAMGSIHDVAREAYSNTRQNAYLLTSGDFR